MEITNKELDQPVVETDYQPAGSEKQIGDSVQTLFGPFSHQPDPEYIRLESERSISEEEATKIIKHRYKLMMEMAARRKGKNQKDNINFNQISHVDHVKVKESTQISRDSGHIKVKETTQISQDAGHVKVKETTQISQDASHVKAKEAAQISQDVEHVKVKEAAQISQDVDIEDFENATQLLHNMHLNGDEIFLHSDFDDFIDLNFGQINVGISREVERMLIDLYREHKKEEMRLYKESQTQGSSQFSSLYDEERVLPNIDCLFEELLDITYDESIYEV